MKKRESLFSGDASRKLWADINAVSKTDPAAWGALYSLGCKLQELEARLDTGYYSPRQTLQDRSER